MNEEAKARVTESIANMIAGMASGYAYSVLRGGAGLYDMNAGELMEASLRTDIRDEVTARTRLFLDEVLRAVEAKL